MDQQQQVLLEVVRNFRENSNREVSRVKRNLAGLSDDDKASLTWKAEDQVKAMEDAVAVNLTFVDKLSEVIKALPPSSSQPASTPHGNKPLQTLLQLFVREWSAEGLNERRECFDRLLGALDGHLKTTLEQANTSGDAPPRVLCPDCQLGRMPFEVQARGYAVEACEARALNYVGTELVRQHCSQPEAHPLQPFVLQTCNRFRTKDHIRVTPIPEVEVGSGQLPAVRFGDFVKFHDAASTRATFDAVLTSFALDTSSNVFRYVRTVAHVVKPGGLWANFGPLAYDTDHDEGHGHGVELSWEELRYAVSHFFEIQEEAFVDSLHAANAESMMQIQYSCVFFRAVRNSAPSPGIGEK